MAMISKSPWIFHVATGGCNGCDIEILATLTPYFSVERAGVVLVGSPRHADILVVTGSVTKKMAPRLKRIYEQMPNPKAVVGVGTCPTSCCVFDGGSYSVAGPLNKILPVDAYVLGCPPRPMNILQALLVVAKKVGKEIKK